MTTERKSRTKDLQLNTVLGLNELQKRLAENHLAERFSNNPEFKAEFIKTFSDGYFHKMMRCWKISKNTTEHPA